MTVNKRFDTEQHLINEFDRKFEIYSIDERGFRYISSMLELGVDLNELKSSQRKIEVMKRLENKPDLSLAFDIDFSRYYNSRKLDIQDFNFIGDSRFERFIYEMHINSMIEKSFINFLPCKGGQSSEYSASLKKLFDAIIFPIKEKIIFLYDSWNVEFSEKRMWIERLRADAFETSRIVRGCKWFDGNDDRLLAAYDHLKADPNCGYFYDSDDLRIYLFKSYGSNPDKIELNIKKIQYLFNNRKSRTTKATKQANFSLSEKSIKNIEKLSSKYGENKSKIVDAVFRDDELIRYVDEFLKSNGSSRLRT